MSDKAFREHTVEDSRQAFQRVFLDGELDGVRVSRETLNRLYGATRRLVEEKSELHLEDVTALKEAERVLEKDGPWREDVCSECRGDVDPMDHVGNPQTGETFCGTDCWNKSVFGDSE